MNNDSTLYMRIKIQAYTTFCLFRYRLTKNGSLNYTNIVNKKISQAFNYPLTHPPLATHKDKRNRESVWVSLMKPRDQGAQGDPKGGREGEQMTRVNNELNKTIM